VSSVRRGLLIWVGLMVFSASIAPMALAQESAAPQYDLSFTLPTEGKSGCMVCHGDENLRKVEDGRKVSYYVDASDFEGGPHADLLCTACHLDFAFQAPHGTEDGEWRRTAKLACRNCHVDQWSAYSAGAHSLAVQPGETTETARLEEKPLCGDCHGAHEIVALTDNPEGRAELHRRGYQVCGRCHEEYWYNYDDYYHGAAYRRGASDAPACWECHGAHDIRPADDRDSLVHENNLVDTCATCHPTANDEYVSYAVLIHGKEEVLAANPAAAFIESTIGRAREAFGAVISWLF